MATVTERFFILTPKPTGKADEKGFTIYRDPASGKEMRWSNKKPIPAIGTRIEITMNGIGWATVVGYFESEGWLGVMTKAENPPEWLRKQNERAAKDATRPEWYRNGIGCEFGTEIRIPSPE